MPASFGAQSPGHLTLVGVAGVVRGNLIAGEPDKVITGIAGLQEAGPGDLSFFANERYIRDALNSKASALLVPESYQDRPSGMGLITCENPSVAFAEVVKYFTPPAITFSPGIHASAVIHASASLNRDKVSIGACAIIAPGVTIGDGTRIDAGCVIGEGSHIGSDCILHPRVTVCHHSEIGDRVRLHSGVVIGSDGFGYEFVNGRHHKIDQVGIVQIDDDVEIGANSTVDRARFGKTKIGKGTKIDNLVTIAHNCVIGRHVIIVAQTGIAGSTCILDYTVIAAQVGVAGHLTVGGPGVILTSRTAVTTDLLKKGTYAGHPAVPLLQHQRQQVGVRKLKALTARVKALEREQQ